MSSTATGWRKLENGRTRSYQRRLARLRRRRRLRARLGDRKRNGRGRGPRGRGYAFASDVVRGLSSPRPRQALRKRRLWKTSPLSLRSTGVGPSGRRVPKRLMQASSMARSASLARPRRANSKPMTSVVAVDDDGQVGPAVPSTEYVSHVRGPPLVALLRDADAPPHPGSWRPDT